MPPPAAGSMPPTVKMELIALDRPAAETINCLLVPAVLHCKFVNAAIPLPAARPMSNEDVPSNDPEPEFKASVRVNVAGNPLVERFPNGSLLLTTGCVARGAPVRDTPPGCAVNTSRSAAGRFTPKPLEGPGVQPAALE